MESIEKSLDELLVKKAPVQLPENAKKTIVEWLPWINLVFGVLQLWAALAFWQLAHLTNSLVDYANSLSAVTGNVAPVSKLGLFFYVSLLVLVADGVLILAAFPGLRAKSKVRGWNLLFYGLVLNVVYGVFRLFTDIGGGFGSLFWSVVSSVIGAYILFQVRSYYTGVKSATKVAPKK